MSFSVAAFAYVGVETVAAPALEARWPDAASTPPTTPTTEAHRPSKNNTLPRVPKASQPGPDNTQISTASTHSGNDGIPLATLTPEGRQLSPDGTPPQTPASEASPPTTANSRTGAAGIETGDAGAQTGSQTSGDQLLIGKTIKLSALYIPIVATIAYVLSGALATLDISRDDCRLPGLSWINHPGLAECSNPQSANPS